MALRAGLLAGWLQACAALPALPHLVSAAGGAGVVAAWQVATEVNEIAYQSEADVCGGWGLSITASARSASPRRRCSRTRRIPWPISAAATRRSARRRSRR